MKILVWISTLDLRLKIGCTPAWWQLLKALHETGNEVIATPYLGKPVESLWWRTYPNPNTWESVAFNRFLDWRKKRGASPSKRTILSPVFDALINHHTKPKCERHILNIIESEDSLDAVLLFNIPINHITGIPGKIRQKTKVPVVYYDGDMPTILPKYSVSRGFKFDYYQGADLSEYDAFFTNSEGCIPDLEEMGAKNVHPLHYGIDPELCSPVDVEPDIDVSFFGYGSEFREEWMEKLITIPSQRMPGVNFAIAGGRFSIDLGKTRMLGDLSYSAWREFACRSKINLNITRWSHTNIYASSTSRPFELAAFGACIVSQPYSGLEKWFDFGKELFVVNSADEAIEVYQRLLDNPEEREETGRRAREKLLNRHTFKHRAIELVDIIKQIKV